MNPLEQNKTLLELCPIPTIIQEMIFNILVGYGTPSANLFENPTIILRNFIKRISRVSFRTTKRLIICHISRELTYFQMLYMYENSPHFSLVTIYELHMIHLKKTEMNPYKNSKVREITSEIQINTKKRLLQMIKEEVNI